MAGNVKKIHSNLVETKTIENVSSIFAITTAVSINQMRSGLTASNEFYIGLWSLYRQLKGSSLALGLQPRVWKKDRSVSLIVTSSGGSFTGPYDDEVMDRVFKDKNALKGDLIVIGQKGVFLLSAKGYKPILAFDSPDIHQPMNVQPLVDIIKQYRYAWAFYQAFESIGVQKMNKINLLPTNLDINKADGPKRQPLDVQSYIFEPSFEQITSYIEGVILNITITQIIFESRLSEYANRFKVTSLVKDRAKKSVKQLTLQYNRTRRQVKDEALRQQLFEGSIL